MSRKDYVLIAQTFKVELEHFPEHKQCLRMLAYQLADRLLQDNNRFDTERFLSACGF
jgi:hypothetical protein